MFVAYEEIAKGCKKLQLLETIDGINEDNRSWSICGIWSKNRWEWHTTLLSAMVCKSSVVGFYDSMGDVSVEYCLNQTRMETMFCSAAYLKKLLGMKDNGMGQYIKNIILFDTDAESAQLR